VDLLSALQLIEGAESSVGVEAMERRVSMSLDVGGE
jgi:hypothetical protein